MRFNEGTFLIIILIGGAILIPVNYALGWSGLAQMGLLLIWSIIISAIIAFLADREIRRAQKERNHANAPKP
jgi:membrane protein implicated in regulation of membrane protease activity